MGVKHSAAAQALAVAQQWVIEHAADLAASGCAGSATQAETRFGATPGSGSPSGGASHATNDAPAVATHSCVCN
jgi:hypothetical protein